MSLDYNLTKIENYEEKCFVPVEDGPSKHILNPLTKILIFYTMAIEMGEITEKNAEEFLARIKIHDRVIGCLGMGNDGEDYHVTLEDVRSHIGLKTNVFGGPKNAFDKKILKSLREDAMRAVRKEKDKPALALVTGEAE